MTTRESYQKWPRESLQENEPTLRPTGLESDKSRKYSVFRFLQENKKNSNNLVENNGIKNNLFPGLSKSNEDIFDLVFDQFNTLPAAPSITHGGGHIRFKIKKNKINNHSVILREKIRLEKSTNT